jgi:hypothetical protein
MYCDLVRHKRQPLTATIYHMTGLTVRYDDRDQVSLSGTSVLANMWCWPVEAGILSECTARHHQGGACVSNAGGKFQFSRGHEQSVLFHVNV